MGVLEQLENINVKRARLFIDFERFVAKDSMYYSNAAAGEIGELCNLLKKKYIGKCDRDGTEITPLKICEEAADVVIYLELLCSTFGLSLAECLRYKFNSKSKEIGSELFLEKPKHSHPAQ